MTDIFQPSPPPQFAPEPQPAPAEPSNGRKGRRGPRKPKAEAAPKPKRAYSRKQSAGMAPARPSAMVLDVSTAIAALAGTTEEDGKFITGVVQAMQAFDADQRKRIVTALARIFA